MSTTRFCADCKYAFIEDEKKLKENQIEIEEYHFYCKLFYTLSIITGIAKQSKCFVERFQSGRCGEEGYFYEPKT